MAEPLSTPNIKIGIYPVDQDEASRKRADQLAVELGLPIITGEQISACELVLSVTSRKLELYWAEPAVEGNWAVGENTIKKRLADAADPFDRRTMGLPIYPDWSSLHTYTHGGGSLQQPIAKALGIKSRQSPALLVIDTTAGWGEDAWLMASLGCYVIMIERQPLVAAMLQDAMERHRRDSPQTVARMSLVRADATQLLDELTRGKSLSEGLSASLSEIFKSNIKAVEDMGVKLEQVVIHLDPMFPSDSAKAKKSTEKKHIRLLRRLAGDDADAVTLWQAAMHTGAKRVVVKRPPHGAVIGGKPTMAVNSKGSRYDVYISSSQNSADAVTIV